LELSQEFPMMYGITKTRAVNQWQVSVFANEDGTAVLRKKYGKVGGKIQEVDRTIYNGKNIGKTNETTPVEQAISEAQSAVNKKYDSNHEYFQMDPDTHIPRKLLPQLCKGAKKGKINWPAYLGKKLNGLCCLTEKQTEEEIIYHSRGGKRFNALIHLTPLLMPVMSVKDILHGELYKHGWSLQKIGSYAKKLKEDGHLLEYWIYDFALVGPNQQERFEMLKNIISPDFMPTIRILEHVIVKSYEEAKVYHDQWVQEGFEGGVLRNMDGTYMFEFNNDELEKVKEYEDAEFVIVGYKEGVGLEEGCIIFRCATEEGKEFDVRPTGTRDDRKEWYKNGDYFIGKDMTVKFAELSDDGIPLQVVAKGADAEQIMEGLAVRDYE